ncbi:MAG: hypothetical protein JWM18_1656 [Chloroflexi bacterium]|nr:hypothetical protein [Chloroflexota bacterium]
MPCPTPLHAGTRRRRALRALVVKGRRGEGPRATLRVAHNGAAERLPGWALEPRMGITAFAAAPRCAALSADPGVFQEERFAFLNVVPRPVAAQIAIAKRAPPASAGEGGREPASGAPAHDVLRPSGGDAVPPESKPAAERPPANLDRRQNCRESRPAVELPGISTGGRTAANLDRRQNCRASRPAAELPRRGDAVPPRVTQTSPCGYIWQKHRVDMSTRGLNCIRSAAVKRQRNDSHSVRLRSHASRRLR